MPEIKKFYFSYGSDPEFPFYYGYTEIEAADMTTAVKIFNVIHPKRPNSNCVNCAFMYNEEQFNKVRKDIGICHERISWEILTRKETQ